jgi:hypothetical protein
MGKLFPRYEKNAWSEDGIAEERYPFFALLDVSVVKDGMADIPQSLYEAMKK